MKATVGVFCVGLSVGIGATWLLLEYSGESGHEAPLRDLEAARTISVELAEQHREQRYENLDSLLEILELPSRFAQREALYILAGRSGSGELQGLVFEASRVVDDDDRDNALRIVFSRLAELDPLSGLALSRHNMFSLEPEIESYVWKAWALYDLENALFEAKTLTSMKRQHLAAQALFSAHGYYNNSTIDRISDELGITPDKSTKMLFLTQLADRSPIEAIEFINGIASMREQMLLVSTLAGHMASKDLESIYEYATYFSSQNLQRVFRRTAMQHSVAADPAPVLDALIRNGRAGQSDEEIMGAIMSIADRDLDAAKRYYATPGLSQQYRQMLGSTIAKALANQDIDEAIEWAKEDSTANYRHNLVTQVLLHVANVDPQLAITYLDQVPAGSQKDMAAQNIMSQWLNNDTTAAVDWLLSADPATSGRFVSQSALMIVYQDIDAARRLLPIVPPQHQANWRQQITRSLASKGSGQQALDFVDQFKDSRGYEKLRGHAITSIAQRDPEQAEQLSRQLPVGPARDWTYSNLIGIKAQRDPVAAIAMLSEISDERAKGSAAGKLGTSWYLSDPVAANNWVDRLPTGLTRDNAIATMVNVWRDSTDETRRLISSISDGKLRSRAKMTQAQLLLQSDPDAALVLLDDPDIPEKTRKQYREWIEDNL